jgi:dihydrofolate reductase
MPALRIEGYVIVSADGMLANAHGVMPDALKFEGDQKFFSNALDHTDLVMHGRNSQEEHPHSSDRRRIILTSATATLAPDPTNPNATLWNPAGASFEEACEYAGTPLSTIAIIGGPRVFEMFLDRYDTFWLSRASHVRLPNGKPCFPGVPERSPQNILAAHGLAAADLMILDAAHDVSVTPWRRLASTNYTSV